MAAPNDAGNQRFCEIPHCGKRFPVNIECHRYSEYEFVPNHTTGLRLNIRNTK